MVRSRSQASTVNVGRVLSEACLRMCSNMPSLPELSRPGPQQRCAPFTYSSCFIVGWKGTANTAFAPSSIAGTASVLTRPSDGSRRFSTSSRTVSSSAAGSKRGCVTSAAVRFSLSCLHAAGRAWPLCAASLRVKNRASASSSGKLLRCRELSLIAHTTVMARPAGVRPSAHSSAAPTASRRAFTVMATGRTGVCV